MAISIHYEPLVAIYDHWLIYCDPMIHHCQRSNGMNTCCWLPKVHIFRIPIVLHVLPSHPQFEVTMFRFMFHWGNKHKRPGGTVAEGTKQLLGAATITRYPSFIFQTTFFCDEYQELDLNLSNRHWPWSKLVSHVLTIDRNKLTDHSCYCNHTYYLDLPWVCWVLFVIKP